MWRALKSGYGHFPRGREGYRTIWRKKKFFGKFFPKGDHYSFWHFPLDSTEDKFFFQSLSFTPKSCGVLLKVVMDIFQEVGKDKGPFREKENFWKIFSQSLQNRGCVERGPLKLLALPFGQHRGQIFFPKSFFYNLGMWRALKTGYRHFPRGREGYRTIWRKKKIFWKIFSQRGPRQLLTLPFGQHRGQIFFQSLSFIP